MVDSSTSRSLISPSSLLCLENLNNDEDEGDDEYYKSSGLLRNGDDEEEEYLHILFVREMRDFELECSISDSIQSARLDSIQWILNARALLGFRLQTAYLSVIYFDRFISRRMMDNEKQWAVRLLTVACLSLAAKMEEIKVPALSQFNSEVEYNLESKVIQRMEILVLTTLEWRMITVTPFDFLHYFVSKLCLQISQRNNVLARTIDLIFAITKDMTSVRHRSSSIAVAATLVAMDPNLTRQTLEIKMNDIPINSLIEIDDVHSCYSGLRKKIDLPNFLTSPELSPGGRNALGVPSSVSTKRKRLKFSECEQDCGLPEK